MKRLFFLLIIAIGAMLSPAVADAQIRFGVTAGANFNNIPVSVAEFKSDNMTAFHIGPMMDLRLGEFPLTLNAALLFSQKGSFFSQEKKSEVFRSNNIDVPINLRLSLFEILAAKVFVQAGPYFSYRISSNADEVLRDMSKLKDFEAKRFAAGLNAGFGLEFFDRLRITAQYGASLSNDYKYQGIGQLVKDYKNTNDKTFSLSAAFLF